MMEYLRGWLVSIVTVIMFLALIELIMPSNNLKKYVKFVTGLIVIVIIIKPVVSLFDSGMNAEATIAQYISTYDKKEIDIDKNTIQKNVNAQTLQIFIEKYKAQIQDELFAKTGKKYSVENLEINEDTESYNFGEIKYIELKKASNDNSIKPVDKVSIGDKNQKEIEYRDQEIINVLKSTFKVDPSNIKFVK